MIMRAESPRSRQSMALKMRPARAYDSGVPISMNRKCPVKAASEPEGNCSKTSRSSDVDFARRDIVEQGCRKEIYAGVDESAAGERRGFLDKVANSARCVDLNAAIATGVLDLRAKNAADRFRSAIVFKKFAKVGVNEAVPIYDQHWIAVDRATCKTDGACRAKRPRLDCGCYLDFVGGIGAQILDDSRRLVSEAKYNPPCAKARQPVEQIRKIRPTGDRRQQFGQAAKDRPDTRS